MRWYITHSSPQAAPPPDTLPMSHFKPNVAIKVQRIANGLAWTVGRGPQLGQPDSSEVMDGGTMTDQAFIPRQPKFRSMS